MVYDAVMRAPAWLISVLGMLTWLSATVLAEPLPGGSPTGPQKPRQGGCDVGWETFALIGGLLVVCFIAGAVSKMRKGGAS